MEKKQKKQPRQEASSDITIDYSGGAIPAAVIEQIKPGVTVRVHQILSEKNSKGEDKKRIQIFEGIVLARRHGNEIGSTITVRKVSDGVGVEKIFPLHSPWINAIEVVKSMKVRRAKLGYLRSYGKKTKEKAIVA